MRLRNVARHTGRTRSGKTLVLFVLVAPVLIGMMGLVVDAGNLMAAYRQTQNAADAAAMAAAMDLFRGSTNATALTTAQSFVTDNGLSATLTLNGGNTSNTLNIPPSITTVAAHQTSSYAEVVVGQTVKTFFIQILGVNSSQTVSARACAGYEPVGAGEGVFVLDPTAAPGLQINTNNTRLVVFGDITVNSQGGGSQVDQYGVSVPGPYNAPAVKTAAVTTPAPIVTTALNVVGGIDTVDNVRSYDPAFSGNGYYYDPNNPDRPLLARAPTAPDPLVSLATPTISSPGTPVVNTNFGSQTAGNGTTLNLTPGIYTNITIHNGGTVNMAPGIYVLQPPTVGVAGGFSMDGGTLSGTGVMIYATGNDYDPTTGLPDANDGSSTPSAPASTKFASLSITGGTIQGAGGGGAFTGLSDANSPFLGIMFYQRRWNTQGASITGGSSTMNFSGTLYAKWAGFSLAGQGTYNAQFLVGSMSVGGGATVTINATGKFNGRANLVFLVE